MPLQRGLNLRKSDEKLSQKLALKAALNFFPIFIFNAPASPRLVSSSAYDSKSQAVSGIRNELLLQDFTPAPLTLSLCEWSPPKGSAYSVCNKETEERSVPKAHYPFRSCWHTLLNVWELVMLHDAAGSLGEHRNTLLHPLHKQFSNPRLPGPTPHSGSCIPNISHSHIIRFYYNILFYIHTKINTTLS